MSPPPPPSDDVARDRPAPRAAPEKSRRDLLAAITSGFVGAVALATSIYGAYLGRQTVELQRQQVRAQVWPKIVSRTAMEGDQFTVYLANRGAGPAILTRIRMRVDGVPMRTWSEFAKKLVGDTRIKIAPDVLTIVAPGQEIVFIHGPLELGAKLQAERRRMRIELCYCSTLDECTTQNDAGDDVPTPNCKEDPVPFRPFSDEEEDLGAAEYLAEHAHDGGPDRDASEAPDARAATGAGSKR